MQAKFVIAKFLWKRTGLAKVGVKGKSLGGKSKGGKRHQALCSEDLYSWQDASVGVPY